MKKTIFFLCYVLGLLIGAMLLIFNYQAMDKDPAVLRYVMMAAGIIFIIPGVIQLISSIVPKKDANGNIMPRKWYATVVGVLSLIWGIYILLFPLGYANTLSITLGVSVALAGLAQAIWIIRTSESTFKRFIIPVVTIAVGILVCILFSDVNSYKDMQLSAIVSGIMIAIWAVNGFYSLRPKEVVAAEKKAGIEAKKAEKEQRKTAEKEAKAEAKAEAEAGKQAEAHEETKAENESESAAGSQDKAKNVHEDKTAEEEDSTSEIAKTEEK
ncbi:MAG: hypothetical protein K2M13_01170 [Muribaculaceae bacterium]|nr:hypothetical protein [Muribaculaceae bacterium]